MGKYIKSLFVAFIFIFLIDNVNAATLTSYSSEYDSCSASNKFTFTNIDTMGNWNYFTGTIGSVISNVPNSMQFDFKYDLSAMKYYDVKFTMTGYDIYSSVNSSMVSISNGSSCGDLSNNNVALVSFTKTSSSSSRYKVMTFRIYSATAVSNWSILLENTSAIAGPENFGISSISINEVDISNTDAIIDNQNSNTDSIIDNQNKNNEELKDTIKDTVESCRPSYNLLPPYNGTVTNRGITVNGENGIYNFSGTWSGSAGGPTLDIEDFILQPGNYTMTVNRLGGSIYPYVILKSNDTQILRLANGVSSSFTLSETTTITHLQFYFNSLNYNSSYSIMLNQGNTIKSFEEYGKEICSNKLDDVNDSINGLTGAITDSSSPDTSGLADAPGWLPAGPVDSIVTLPINLLQSLTNNLENACTPINLPIPFIDHNLTLDCPATLLKKIDGFWLFWEGFGLIAGVWILYKYFINLYKWVESHLSMDEKESLGKWGGV